MAIETIAIIRDLFIIVFAGTFTLAVLVTGLWLFRLYRSVHRTGENLEEISSIVLNRVARPLSTVPPLMDVVKYVEGWIQECRSREISEEDDRLE